MATTVSAGTVPAAGGRRTSEHRFYAAVGILLLLMTAAGFGPSIIEPSNRNVPLPMTALVLTHGAAASAWILLFLVQTTLVATGRTRTHRRLGLVGIGIGVVFVVSGCLMMVQETARGFDLSGDLIPRDRPVDAPFVFVPVAFFGLFVVLVGTALWYRRRPDIHKRLMALSMLGPLAGAPMAHLIGHYPWLGAHPALVGTLSTLVLIALPAIYDRMSLGRIHPASLWGGLGSFAWFNVFFGVVAPSSAWRDFTLWLVT